MTSSSDIVRADALDLLRSIDAGSAQVIITDADLDQEHTAQASYPPHFIQRLGFWG